MRGAVVNAPGSTTTGTSGRLPFVVPLLAMGTFLMCTSEYIVAGLLQQISAGLTFLTATAGVGIVLSLLIPLSALAVPTVILVILLGIVGMAVPPVATGLAVRFAPSAPTLAAALAVAAFNAGTAIASWIESDALEGPLGVTAPESIGIAMVVLGAIPLVVLALRRATRQAGPDNPVSSPKRNNP